MVIIDSNKERKQWQTNWSFPHDKSYQRRAIIHKNWRKFLSIVLSLWEVNHSVYKFMCAWIKYIPRSLLFICGRLRDIVIFCITGKLRVISHRSILIFSACIKILSFLIHWTGIRKCMRNYCTMMIDKITTIVDENYEVKKIIASFFLS